MFKLYLLSSVRLFEADKETGSDKVAPVDPKEAAAKQREGIEVTSTNDDKDKDADDNDNKDGEGEKEEETETEEEEETENEEPKEEVELTAEQKTIKKLESTIARLQKRVGRTSGERDAIKKELKDAKEALEAKVAEGEQPLTEEEVKRRAKQEATEIVATEKFADACNRLSADAKKADKEFQKKIDELAEDIAPIPSAMVGILDDLDHGNGGAVLAYLANNPDDFEAIHTLPLPKMARRLDKISNQLVEEAKKAKEKKISGAPPPLAPVGGNRQSPNVLTGKESMEDFVRIRNQQTEERRKARLR